jgi:hypothetical protein
MRTHPYRLLKISKLELIVFVLCSWLFVPSGRQVTSEDDTHPSPNERFRLTKKIVTQSEPPISGMVWDLFRDRTALTLEMTSTIQTLLRN